MRLFKLAGFVVMLGLCVAGSSDAQPICALGTAPLQHYNPVFDQPPSLRADQELKTIYHALCTSLYGCGNYLLVSNPTTPTLIWAAIGPGQSKIAYNPAFMNGLAVQYGPGATFGVLAHGFGHHIDFNTSPPWMNNSWSRELKADAWAGCALAKIGVGTGQIENALRAIAAFPPPGHPAWPQRQLSVRTGFINCGGQWLSSFGY